MILFIIVFCKFVIFFSLFKIIKLTISFLFFFYRNIFPDNMITPFFISSYSKTKILWPANLSTLLDPNYYIETQNEKLINYKANMLSLCIISLCLGVILQKLGSDRTKRIRALLYEADTIIHYVMQFLMKFVIVFMFF